jgi:hypothetical protein
VEDAVEVLECVPVLVFVTELDDVFDSLGEEVAVLDDVIVLDAVGVEVPLIDVLGLLEEDELDVEVLEIVAEFVFVSEAVDVRVGDTDLVAVVEGVEVRVGDTDLVADELEVADLVGEDDLVGVVDEDEVLVVVVVLLDEGVLTAVLETVDEPEVVLDNVLLLVDVGEDVEVLVPLIVREGKEELEAVLLELAVLDASAERDGDLLTVEDKVDDLVGKLDLVGKTASSANLRSIVDKLHRYLPQPPSTGSSC